MAFRKLNKALEYMEIVYEYILSNEIGYKTLLVSDNNVEQSHGINTIVHEKTIKMIGNTENNANQIKLFKLHIEAISYGIS
jgi:hypothetical protein